MKHIELQYNSAVNVDLIETILKEKFPGKELARQNFGLHSPFIKIYMGGGIIVTVAIAHDKNKNITTVLVRDGQTFGSAFFTGIIGFLAAKKNHRTDVMNAVREGLMEKINPIFLTTT